MAKQEITTKKIAISKANAQMFVAIMVTCFITVFCLIASKSVWSHNVYLAKVISAKQKARTQLSDNLKSYEQLKEAYNDFESKDKNAIGGSRTGTGDNDGPNSKIVLDSLPSTYDFPALASSIEKIITDRGLKVSGITGTDDQVNQESNLSSSSPSPIPIPFSFTVDGANYASLQQVISALQLSIRPIVIDSINITGGGNQMTATVSAHTYYQPSKNIKIKMQDVK